MNLEFFQMLIINGLQMVGSRSEINRGDIEDKFLDFISKQMTFLKMTQDQFDESCKFFDLLIS